VVFPEGGSTVKHAALLLSEWLADRAREARRARAGSTATTTATSTATATSIPTPTSTSTPTPTTTAAAPWPDVIARVRALQETHAGRWSKEFDSTDAGADELAREAARLLVGFGLATFTDGGALAARPAAARFAPRDTAPGRSAP